MDTFGENLKALRNRDNVSQLIFAQYLGVAQNTIANYENNKRFPDKTALIMIADYFKISLDSLMGRVPLEVRDTKVLSIKECEAITTQLIDYIIEGNEKAALQVILEKGTDNTNIFILFEQVLRKAAIEFGLMWHQGRLNIAWEHYATGIVDKILTLLSAKLVSESPNNKSAICMSYSSDPHTIGVRMISEYLNTRGYKSYYLGSNTTTDSLMEMLKQLRPEFLMISVTMNYHLDGLKNLVERIRAVCDCTHIKIVVGGQAFSQSKEEWKRRGADGYATTLTSLEKFIDQKVV